MVEKPILNKQTRTFFEVVFKDGNYFQFWTPGRNGYQNTSYWHPVAQPIPEPPDVPLCIYFGVNPVREIPKTNAKGKPKPPQFVRSQIQYIMCANVLYAEFDFKDFGGSQEATIQHIRSIPVKPSVGVFSGGGYHCYWILNKTFFISSEVDITYLQQVQSNWVKFVGGDPAAKDLARVLRVPGTRNYKPCYAPNYPQVKMVKVEFDLRYDLDFLAEISRPVETEAVNKSSQPPPLTGTPDQIAQEKMHIAACMIRGAKQGEKHPKLFSAALLLGGYVAGGFLTYDQAREHLEEEIGKKPVDDLARAKRTIKDALAYGMERPIMMPQTQSE